MQIPKILSRGKIKYLTDEGKAQTLVRTGEGTTIGLTAKEDRKLSDLAGYWQYYKGEGIIFASINATAYNTVMVGFTLESDNEEARDLIQQVCDVIDLDSALFEATLHCLIFGDAYLEKRKIRKGDITKLSPVDPQTMIIEYDKYGNIKSYQQEIGGRKVGKSIKPEDIIHVRFIPIPGSPYGVSMIEPNIQTIDWLIDVKNMLYNAVKRHSCYDDKTEILTENGWKLFNDLNEGESVATLNPEKDSIEYIIPEEIVKYPYTGEMDSYQNSYIDMVTTPNHEHYVKFQHGRDKHWSEYKKTSNFETSRFKFKACANNFDGKLVGVPDEFDGWSLKQFIEFLGYYLSEGSLHHDKQFIIHQSDGSTKLKRMEALCKSLPLECHHKKKHNEGYDDGNCFTFYSARIGKYLKQFGICDTKFIPKEFKNLPQEYLQILFDALIDGDGHVYSDTNKYYYSTSKRLVDDIQEIALKLGWSTSVVNGYPPDDKPHWKDSYILHCRKKYGLEPYFESRRVKQIQYNGFVHCVHLGDKVFFIRRNGKAIISGNTPKIVATVGTEKDGQIPPDEVMDAITAKLDDINEINEFVLPWMIKLDTIDEGGMEGITEIYNLFQALVVIGMMCPEEAFGQGKNVTEASARVKAILFERIIKSYQHRLATAVKRNLFDEILLDNGFKSENNPDVALPVRMKFNSVTEEDEAMRAKWLGNLLRGFPDGQLPFTRNEIRAFFAMSPREGMDDVPVGKRTEDEEGEQSEEEEKPEEEKPEDEEAPKKKPVGKKPKKEEENEEV